MNISLVLIIAALVLFILAAIGIPSGRLNLIAAGLACLTAAELFGRRVLGFALIAGAFLLSSCSSTQQAQLQSALASPAGQVATKTATAAAISAVTQYNATGKVDAGKVEAAALSAAIIP